LPARKRFAQPRNRILRHLTIELEELPVVQHHGTTSSNARSFFQYRPQRREIYTTRFGFSDRRILVATGSRRFVSSAAALGPLSGILAQRGIPERAVRKNPAR